MSQINTYGKGGVLPTVGIETITGDIGGPADGDGGIPNNINIVGAGTITVNKTAAHTLTITDTAAGATYYTSDGNYAIPVASRLNIYQGTNILTTSAGIPGNTITVGLAPNVTLAGFLHAGAEVTSGTYVQAAGNVISGAILQGNNLTINTFAAGALVTDGTHVVSSVNGPAGTVLTANIGGSPTFQAIPFPAAPTVTGTANQISVSAGPNYVVSLPIAITTPGSLITTTAMRVGTNLIVGNQVTFSAIVNGVLGVNGLGNVSASNGFPTGTNGQIIISGPVSPTWGSLTSTGGTINITNPGPNRINLESVASSPALHSSFFARQPADAILIADGAPSPFAYIGSTMALTDVGSDCFNIGGNLYIGSGAGVPASYIAPSNGSYYFEFNACVFLTNSVPQPTFSYFHIDFYNATKNIHYSEVSDIGFGQVIGTTRYKTQRTCIYVKMDAGDAMLFGIFVPGTTGARVAGIGNITGDFFQRTWVSGYKVS